MTAERDKRAEVLESDGVKQAAINDSKGNREEAINRSKGEKQKKINEAEGKAKQLNSKLKRQLRESGLLHRQLTNQMAIKRNQ